MPLQTKGHGEEQMPTSHGLDALLLGHLLSTLCYQSLLVAIERLLVSRFV